MRWLKLIIPPSLRLRLRILQKYWQGIYNGQRFDFVKRGRMQVNYPSQLSLRQIIRPNNYSTNKVHNLQLAISCIENRLILPGQVFSFWHLVPRPTSKNGFREGRNLVGAELATDIGGGLCQQSGILYHLSLMAGLEIVERHPHSKDIYNENNRYTPLGSDATVVYGHKDFRFRNNLGFAFYFSFELSEDSLTAHLCAEEKVKGYKLRFESLDKGSVYRSMVHRLKEDGQWEKISEHEYERL